ncbi:S-layer family protein [Alkalinema sp. FACHB-956]|uniref:beta strand repeat-containing protein n=1 Tax=Alkalinema sp. FACHB-956 TaxID=2692768 RepID=UPI001684891A|nr:S-layer family protein [Alkalinema sp. FACHB-956]MBD2328028.1 S-layer family protein [Alkalinema sp. FACHB-956]
MKVRSIVGVLGVLMGFGPWMEIANAQVIPDGSLPTTVSSPNARDFTIDGGGRSGGNLFHSFSQFSVPTGGSAFFNNALDVQNIFARVTGGTASNIDGLLKANGGASLFLLNPIGILFGPNASLNLGGSFIGTTASSIQFADGTAFSATNSSTVPLLTMSAPIGLQMGQNPGEITVQNTGHRLEGGGFLPFDASKSPIGLQAGFGQTLALVGGNVNFSGGILSIKGVGRLEVSSVNQGQVSLTSTQQGWVGDYSSVSQFGDIHLADQSLLDVSGYSGTIALQGRNISLADGSFVLKNSVGSQSAGGIVIHATDSIHLVGNTVDGLWGNGIYSTNLGLGTVEGVRITANQLLLQDGARIEARTFTPAGSGNMNVNVRDRLEVHGFNWTNPINVSGIGSATFGSGKAGEVLVTANHVQLLRGGSIFSATASTGQAGQVTVNVADLIEIADAVPATASSSSIVSSSIGAGNAGDVLINTSRLLLRESGVIGSTALASGSTGNITVNATESVEMRGVAEGLALPSRLLAAVEIVDPRTQAFLRVPAIPTGNAGTVTINTPVLKITDRATLSVRNDGPGQAGDIRFNTQSTLLDGKASITASTMSGSGGNIYLNHGHLLLMRHGSVISVSTQGTGDGGNITLQSPIILGLENSDIIANAVRGKGGNINITTQGILGLKFRGQLTPDNDITASSEFGLSGNVQVNTIGTDPNAGLTELPVNVSDSSQKIATGCAANQGSQFVATGRGGIPQNPNQQIVGDRGWTDLRDLSNYRGNQESVAQAPATQPLLLQASGWQRNADGSIELVARSGSVSPGSIATCSGGLTSSLTGSLTSSLKN